MKTKKSVIIGAFTVLSVASAPTHAGQETKGPGPTGTLLRCSDSKGRTLRIENTAVVTYKTAVLDLNQEGRVLLGCKMNLGALEATPDQLNTLLTCVERRNGEGKFVVVVETGGHLGKTFANIGIEQMFPLKSKRITTMQCGR